MPQTKMLHPEPTSHSLGTYGGICAA